MLVMCLWTMVNKLLNYEIVIVYEVLIYIFAWFIRRYDLLLFWLEVRHFANWNSKVISIYEIKWKIIQPLILKAQHLTILNPRIHVCPCYI